MTAAEKIIPQFVIVLCFYGICTTLEEAGNLHTAYSVVGVNSHANYKATVVLCFIHKTQAHSLILKKNGLTKLELIQCGPGKVGAYLNVVEE